MLIKQNTKNYGNVACKTREGTKFNLSENGMILTYFYEINKNIRNFFNENNYTFDNFQNNKSGIMVYKRK